MQIKKKATTQIKMTVLRRRIFIQIPVDPRIGGVAPEWREATPVGWVREVDGNQKRDWVLLERSGEYLVVWRCAWDAHCKHRQILAVPEQIFLT